MKKVSKAFKEWGIKKQILVSLIACSLITLLISTLVFIGGIIRLNSAAVNMGSKIGTFARETSGKVLNDGVTTAMQRMTEERAEMMRWLITGNYVWCAELLSSEMTRILQHPEDYQLRSIPILSADNAKSKTPVLRLAQVKSVDKYAGEVALMANLQDWMKDVFMDEMGYVKGIYCYSVNGFGILCKRDYSLYVDENNNVLPFNYYERPWYKDAIASRKVVLSNVYSSVYTIGEDVISASIPYYDKDGDIAGVICVDYTLSAIQEQIERIKMKKTGFGFILNDKGYVVFSPKQEGVFSVSYNKELSKQLTDDGRNAEVEFQYRPSLLENENLELVEVVKKMLAGETGISLISIDGKNYFLSYTPIKGSEGWSFGMLLEEDDALESEISNGVFIDEITKNSVHKIQRSILFTMLTLLVILVLATLLSYKIGKKITDDFTDQLNVLTKGVNEISEGNFDKQIELRADNELKHLAECFNGMTKSLNAHISNLEQAISEKQHIETEMKVAASIQQSMLRHDFNIGRNDVEIYASMQAAKVVGGDFYGFYFIDDKRLMFSIADVSGKGVGAALFMANSKSVLKDIALKMDGDDIAAVMTEVNKKLCCGNDEAMFVTVFVALLNLETGKLVYVNGGHNPPLIYRKNEDKFKWFETEPNCVLGLMEDVLFKQQEIKVNAGDIIYLYTDGVTEAMNKDKEQYGEQRLEDCLNSLDPQKDLKSILESINLSLSAHVGDADQSDDITMLAVRFVGM